MVTFVILAQQSLHLKAENTSSSTIPLGSKGKKTLSLKTVESKPGIIPENRNEKRKAKAGFYVKPIFPRGAPYVLYEARGECSPGCSGMAAFAAQLPSSRSPRRQPGARRRSLVQSSLSGHLENEAEVITHSDLKKKKKASSLETTAHTRSFVVCNATTLSDGRKHSSSVTP